MLEDLNNQFQNLCSRLVSERNSNGFWDGMLSSSALSTSVSIVVFRLNGNETDEIRIKTGLRWLLSNVNADGGFGDTPRSESNVCTSLLSYAAVFYCQSGNEYNEVLKNIERYLETRNISLNSETITSSILEFYGKDFTFSVPILSMLTICGVLPRDAVKRIPQLPFELALLPSAWYRFFNLQVVSYAVPALIGVGIYTHYQRKTGFSLTGLYRNKCINPAIHKLTRLMPASGGFLEAIPLTAFVGMCLIAGNNGNNEVVTQGLSFLRAQQREDGSWPIDTNLSTWVTASAAKAIGAKLGSVLGSNDLQQLRSHLLSLQYKEKHPFNGAAPGGWGWTSFSGSVPDADDTPAAILALLSMYEGSDAENEAIIKGCTWLTGVQNTDGGFPTFCKGWNRLPFDKSSADLTGHALLAITSTMERPGVAIPKPLMKIFLKGTSHAISYLEKQQAADGHWDPLWFGNQLVADKKNPVYGTSKVCTCLIDCLNKQPADNSYKEKIKGMISKAQRYLILQQNNDGSWGGAKDIPGSIEETSLAICALAEKERTACVRGFEWLAEKTENQTFTPAPIGLYFAMLWYDEKMYPLIYYTEAVRRFSGY